MTCAELEILLCDYVDGTLAADQRLALEQHLAGCPGCAQLAGDVAGTAAFLETVPAVGAPRELVTRILRQIPAQQPWWQRMWSGWFEAVLQPRFVMGTAMAILSVSMFVQLAGFHGGDLVRTALNPARVWQTLDDRGYRVWDRTVKYYDDMPLVAGLRSQWDEWSEPNPNDDPRGGQ